jgi:hypothetical protein
MAKKTSKKQLFTRETKPSLKSTLRTSKRDTRTKFKKEVRRRRMRSKERRRN